LMHHHLFERLDAVCNLTAHGSVLFLAKLEQVVQRNCQEVFVLFWRPVSALKEVLGQLLQLCVEHGYQFEKQVFEVDLALCKQPFLARAKNHNQALPLLEGLEVFA